MAESRKGDGNYNSINQSQLSLKGIIFELVYVVIKEDEYSMILQGVLACIQYVHLLYLAFHPSVVGVWQSTLGNGCRDVFGYISIIQIYFTSSYTAFIILFYFSAGVTVFFLSFFLYALMQIMKQRPLSAIITGSLKLFVNLFLTILFIPFLYTQLSVLNCSGGALSLFPEIQCWSGMHILHACCGIICSILFTCFCLLFGLLYFEGIHSDEKANSKKDNRQQFTLIILDTILILFFVFLNATQSQVVLVFAVLFAGTINFYMIHTLAPFNNLIVQRYQSLFSALFLWTGILLVMAYLTEQRIFLGVSYAWVIGLPLLVLIVLQSPLQRKKREGYQSMNVNKFGSPEEVIDHINYVLSLIVQDQRKTVEGQLLNGYIEFHNKTCLNPGCPIKKIKFTSSQWRKQKNQAKAAGGVNNPLGQRDKRYSLINETMQRIYQQAIAKFPGSVLLRIHYAIFLTSVMKSKQHALNEVQDTETLKCSIDESYILFFIKRTIETQISELSKDGGGDYSEQRNLEGQIQQFRNAMEAAVQLLMEFWSQFSDDKPDLLKLYDIGGRLFPLKQMVEEIWKRISRMKGEHIPKVLRIYSKYLIDIFNDRRAGNELLDKANKMDQNYNYQRDLFQNISVESNIDGQEDGLIYMTMDEEKMGQIQQINLSCASMLGYSKSELINKNVTTITPVVIGKLHDEILRKYVETNESYISNSERPLWIKTKSNYLYAVEIFVKPVYHPLKDNMEFFAKIKRTKSFKNIAYVLCSTDGVIKDISCTAINILGIDYKNINNQQVNITQLIPDIFEMTEEYESKQGKTIEYTFPKIQEDNIQYGKGTQKVQLQVHMHDQVVQQLKKSVGFIIKCELKLPKATHKKKKKGLAPPSNETDSLESGNNNNNANKNESFSIMDIKKPTFTIFQFKMTIFDGEVRYHGEIYEGLRYDDVGNNTFIVDSYQDQDLSSLNATNILSNTTSNVVLIQTKREKDRELEIIREEEMKEKEGENRRNWGEGIKIVRWMNGNYVEPERDESVEDSEEEREKQKEDDPDKQTIKKNGDDLAISEIQNAGFHVAKDLNQELIKQAESSVVQRLRIISLFGIAAMLILCIVDFSYTSTHLSDGKNNLNMVLTSSRQIAETQKMVNYIRELVFLNRGIRIPQYVTVTGANATNSTDEIKLRQYLSDAITNLEDLTNTISTSGNYPSRTLDVFFDNSTSQNFDLNYASQQIISRALSASKLDLRAIESSESECFFILQNCLNNYALQLFGRYEDINQKTFDDLNSIDSQTKTVLIISIVLLLVFVLILTEFLGRTIHAKQQILVVFLEIPEQTSKFLYQKCENFLAQLGSGDEDEVNSELEGMIFEQKHEGDEDKVSIYGHRRKKFKNAEIGNCSFFLKMLLIGCVIEVYYIVIAVLGPKNTTNITKSLNEFNLTAIAEPYYSMTLNGAYQTFLDPTFTVLNSVPTDVAPGMIDIAYDIDSRIHELHAVNNDLHNNSVHYSVIFENLMFKDACATMVTLKAVSASDCDVFGYGIVKQGMVTVIIRYFQLMRFMRDRIQWILANPTKNFDFTGYTYTAVNYTSNRTKNNLMNIQRMSENYEMMEIQTKYMSASFRYLQDNFRDEMNIVYDDFSVERVLLLVIFIICLCFTTFLCWMPFLSQLNKEIWSTKCLLSFIPVDEMARIKTITQFIREVILDRKI